MDPGAATGAYNVSAADLGRDRAAIIDLCSSVIEGFTAARYEKYYERNPYGTPLVVTARTETDGELVGVAALHPQQMQLDGEVLAVGVAGDFGVHPGHRAFGPALALQRELTRLSVESRLDLAIGVPDDAATGVLRRVGYSRVGRFVRLTHPLRLRDRLRGRALSKALVGHSPLELASFDTDLESLLEGTHSSNGIALHRSRTFLAWRFELDRIAVPGRFSALSVTREGASVACAVFHDNGGSRRIVDLTWLDAAGLAAVLAAVVQQSRDAGIAAVDLLCFGGTGELVRECGRLGFFAAVTPDVWRPHVWCRGGSARGLGDSGRWLLFDSAFDL